MRPLCNDMTVGAHGSVFVTGGWAATAIRLSPSRPIEVLVAITPSISSVRKSAAIAEIWF
jgi:hypothetical protein